MAIAFRSSSTGAISPGSPVVAAVPTGTAVGDLLLYVVSRDVNGITITPPSGWTVGHTDNITNGDTQTTQWGWKIATSGDLTGSYSFTLSNGSNNCTVCVAAYSGVDGTTPFDGVTPAFSNPNSATVPTSPVTVTATGVTTASANDFVVALAAVDTDNNNGVWTTSSGMTIRQQASSSNQFTACMIADVAQAIAGASGNKVFTWTQSGAHGNFAAYTLALRPSGGGGGGNALAGTVALAFDRAANLSGVGKLLGVAALLFAGSLVSNPGAIRGSAAALFGSTAAVKASGALHGTAAMAFGPTATATQPTAAFAVVQSGQNSTAQNSTTTVATGNLGSSNTAGNLIFYAISYDGGGTLATAPTIALSDTQGNTYTKINSLFDSGNGLYSEIGYAKNIKAGTNSVTATFSGSLNSTYWKAVSVMELAGLDQTTPFTSGEFAGQNQNATVDTPSSGNTPTLSSKNKAAVGFSTYKHNILGSNTFTAGSGWTIVSPQFWDFSFTGNTFAAFETMASLTSTSPVDATFVNTNFVNYDTHVAAFNLASVPAGALVGSSAITTASVAGLTAKGALAGTSALAFTATLTRSGSISATVPVAFASVAALNAGGKLAGSSALAFGETGTLSVPQIHPNVRQVAFFDTSPSHGGAGTINFSFAKPTLSGSNLVIFGTISNFAGTHTLVASDDTSGANTYTKLDTLNSTANQTYSSWISEDADPTTQITIVSDGGSGFDDYFGAIAVEVIGAVPSGLIGHHAQFQTLAATTTDGISTGNVTGVSGPSLMVAIGSNDSIQDGNDVGVIHSPFAPVAGTGQTELLQTWQFDLGDPATTLQVKAQSASTVAGTFTPPTTQSVQYMGMGVLVQLSAGPIFAESDLIFGSTAALGGKAALSGTCALVIGSAASLSLIEQIAGSCPVSFDSSASLAGAGKLSGLCSVEFAGTGSAGETAAIAATVPVSFNVSGALTGAAPISASSALIFDDVAALHGAGKLAGTCALAFTAAAGGGGTVLISGSSALAFASAAEITGVGSIAAQSALSFAQTADLHAAGKLAGTAALGFGASAAVAGTTLIDGSTTLTFAQIGAITGRGALAGRPALTFAATGSISAQSGTTAAAAITFDSSATIGAIAAISGSAQIQFDGHATNGRVAQISGSSGLAFDTSATILGRMGMRGTAPLTLGASASLSGAASVHAACAMQLGTRARAAGTSFVTPAARLEVVRTQDRDEKVQTHRRAKKIHTLSRNTQRPRP